MEKDTVIETICDIKINGLFAEVVRGMNGVYICIEKGGNSVCLTADESLYLRNLIKIALKENNKEFETFDSEPE